MDLHHLKLFNTLAEESSFSKAAAVLYISQPAVSMQIKKLEKVLGLKLIERSGKNVYLTESGRFLYEYTKKIFALVDEAESAFNIKSESIRGIVEIGASNTPGNYILPCILGEFKERYPDVITNLHIANTYEIERQIIENKVDFAINGGEISYSEDICTEELFCDEMVFISSPASIYAPDGNVGREKLADARFITHERNSQLYRLFEEIISELGIPENVVMTIGSIEAIKQAVSAGLGITVIPASAIKNELKYGLLKAFTVTGGKWEYPYKLIYYSKRRLSPAAKHLMHMIRNGMKQSNSRRKL